MKICFMDNDARNLEINSFIIKGKTNGEYGAFDFKDKSIIEEVWLNRESLIIRVEKLSKGEYKIRFIKRSVENDEIEVEYEDDIKLEIKCCKCGRKMKHLITKYPLSDFLINCYTERFYNCLKIEGGCGYEVIIGVDECKK